jgi:myosin heavy subunit
MTKGSFVSGILRSLVVAIYRKLFESIVDEMNQTLEVGTSASDELGILDMYGFESLETNGLAQILSCRE